MPELVAPTVSLHAAWLDARDDWGPGVHEDGFGLRPSDEVDSPDGFAAWVARLTASGQPGDADRPRCTFRWIVEDGRVLGGIALRHQPSDLGQIGYGIRPSARRRGLATWALGRMLDEARALGTDRLLIVCVADNTPSARTIERNGGVLDGVVASRLGPVRRYQVVLRPPIDSATDNP
ncbi:GNAT family N-acetyltransferase [Micromonospora siamensis]|uniref:Predicted acetyltransferase n=1 Tax=Micromonospora siamensis TaxID=299152 RepID=A0A1C5HX63_9ACTN|nr:GNAT family N-acetyltransferase [Micromonospora siamensis]SCG50614.1 Predicted acetyltransferase [Micromonospora siamensis]